MIDYSITELNISKRGLTQLPPDIDKYANLKKLICSNNKLTSLDNLPPTLTYLDCCNNQITSLDNLPPTLEKLYCENNPLIYDFKPTLKNIRKYKKH